MITIKEFDSTKWKLFLEELLDRISIPFNHPEFIFYFLFIVIGIGSCGIWSQLIMDFPPDQNFARSISTYFIALLSSSIIDLILIKKSKINNIFILVGISSLILGGIFAVLSIYLNILYAYLGIGLSWFIWWIANSENNKLTRKPLPFSSIGNNPNQQLVGTKEGYQT